MEHFVVCLECQNINLWLIRCLTGNQCNFLSRTILVQLKSVQLYFKCAVDQIE